MSTPISSSEILQRLPGSLPKTEVPNGIDIEAIATHVIGSLNAFEDTRLTEDAIWRDSFSLTGTLRTFYGRNCIKKVWTELAENHGAELFQIVPNSTRVVRVDSSTAWVETRFTFRTTAQPPTYCSGFLSLVLAGGSWKIWVLRTILEQLSGAGDVDKLDPTTEKPNTKYDPSSPDDAPRYFDAVVVGGSQSGLSTGGRFQALGVSYVVLERNHNVGDAWRLRYGSARLHTIREYAHLPFDRTFGPECEEFLSKETLANGHQKWAEIYGINIWLSTNLESGSWNDQAKEWTLNVKKQGTMMKIRAKYIVFATGAGSSTPVMPEYADRQKFRGLVLHSVDYKSAESWQGKSGIVIGTANTGHDVANDMVDAGLSSVTMVQRSRTYVLPVEYITDRYKVIYNEQTPTELSDRLMFTNPTSISRLVSAKAFHSLAQAEPQRWEGLERAGFKVDPYGDIQYHISVRLGGHYIDVGTSKKISEGQIKMKSDAMPVRYGERSLIFSDGTEIQADVIVFTTGFVGNLRQHVASILGPEVAARSEDCFGLNEEGEILGAFKPNGHPGLWYIGGALGHARYYSRYIALHVKADTLGHPLPVYLGNPHRIH